MQLILPAIYALFFILLICKMNFFVLPVVSRTQLVLLFALKLSAAAIVWFIYTYYYSGSDFFTYFNDSSRLVHNVFHSDHQNYSMAWTGNYEDSLLNGSKIMIILNALLHLFSFGNFYVHGVFFVFFSFLGLVALLKAFVKHFPHKKGLIIALFFIPGVLFWGSAPLKEALVIGASGFMVYVSDFGLRKSYSKKAILILILSALILLLVRAYVFLVFLPVIIANVFIAVTSAKKVFLKYLLVFGTLGGMAAFAAFLTNDLNLLKLISDKRAKAISEAKGGVFLANEKSFIHVDYEKQYGILESQKDKYYRIRPGSAFEMWKLDNMSDTIFVTNSSDTSLYKRLYIIVPASSVLPLHKLKPLPLEFLKYTPSAFLSTLLQPTFTQIHSWFQLVAAIENCWMIILIILSLCFFDRNVLVKKEILFFCFVFFVLLFILIGFTTPVIGAMVRYKTIGSLFLAALCFIVLDEEKLKKKLFRK
jgi:hypothetical protein